MESPKANFIKPTPILRWAGGKSWLLKSLPNLLPDRFNDYHEPFLGGASIYLFLKKNSFIKAKSYLSDLNPDLINFYRQVRNNYSILVDTLKQYRNSESYYYYVRAKSTRSRIERAADFLYLNRTSFNGIFRVNLCGKYNVPYGFKSYDQLFNLQLLNETRLLLRTARLTVCDFEETLTNVKKGDFVFMDPPYTIAHNHNGFIKYNQKLFSWSDQERLLEYIRNLNHIGAFFILTNAAHRSIFDLFTSECEIMQYDRTSLVGGKGAVRSKVTEYLLTNVK